MVALGIVGIILLLTLAGMGAIYASQWASSSGLPLPSGKPPADITPDVNDTTTNITGDPLKDFGKEVDNLPAAAIWDIVFGGVKEFVIWLGRVAAIGITYVGRISTCITKCNPSFEAPWWSGYAFAAVLTALFFMQGLGKLFDVGHRGATWAIILGILLLVFGVLSAW